MSEPRNGPPEAPKIPPRLRFRKVEAFGVAVMALLPIAAIAGAFGPTLEREEARAGSIGVEAEYPSRIRTAMAERITVSLTNEAADPATDIEVAFDARYVNAFSDLGFAPEPHRPYVFTVDELRAGETQRIEIEVHADEYGRHEGRVAVRHSGGEAELPLRTLILP